MVFQSGGDPFQADPQKNRKIFCRVLPGGQNNGELATKLGGGSVDEFKKTGKVQFNIIVTRSIISNNILNYV